MSDSLRPDRAYWKIIEHYKELDAITDFIANMPTAKAALFSFLFLPFLLLGWLMLFKLFDITAGLRKWGFLTIIVVYVVILYFFKVESNRQLRLNSTKKRVLNEMVYKLKKQYPARSLCHSLKIDMENLREMCNDQFTSFHITPNNEGELIFIVVDSEILETIINKRKDLVKTLKANKEITVDSLKVIASEAEFGNLTEELVHEVVAEDEGLEIVQEEGKEIIRIVEP